MRQWIGSELWASWLYALTMACIFLFIRGYAFNTGDQAEHLPQVYQILDAQLYPNDYFVPQMQAQFTVRHFYEQLALVVARTIGLEWGAFLLTLLCITVMAWAFQRIAWEIFKERWAALLAPVMVLLVFYDFTVGGNNIIYGTLISSTLAKAIASVAILQFMWRRWAAAGVLLGVASLFQVLVGLQLMLVLTVALPILSTQKRCRGMIGFWTAYLVPALFILVPVLRQQFGSQGAFDAELYYEILYRFRNYHHYLPSLFPVTHYIKFFGLMALGIACYLFTRPADRHLFPALVAAVLFGMVAYTVGLEGLDIHALGKLQWFKSTIWAAAFSAVMVAGVIGMFLQTLIPSRNIVSASMALSCAVISLLLLTLMTNSAWLPERFDGRFMVGNRHLSDLERMHAWISAHTAKDAMVLVGPENTSFSCQAKRPMPVHFHAIIHTPQFMLPWYGKVQQVYGVGLADIGIANARQLATDRYATRNYTGNSFPIRYRLDNLRTCMFVDELGPTVHREGVWALSEFTPR
ncbi:MAG: hypothetical protein K9J06_05020 [Flavobacteriales bacterium]|nr:hypothetical protein [Flavobacteriales bacterium]